MSTLRIVTLFLAIVTTGAAAAPVRAQVTQAEYASRRDSLAARLGDGVTLVLGAPEPAQNYVTFYQNEPMLYLTGFQEPNAALVMVKRGGQVTGTMFVQPRDPALEVWTGNRLGTEGITRTTGLAARNEDQLRPVLDSLLGSSPTRLYVVGDVSPQRTVLSPDDQLVRSLAAAHPNATVVSGVRELNALRGLKSAAELDLIRRAIDISVRAQREAMRAVAPGVNEFEVQALVEYTFRRNGVERPSFSTILGSGPNSTTLHYNVNDRFMQAGEVVTMDVGAAYRGYAADVTRTVPVSGTFTPDQRAIYQAVRNAQAAAERQAVLGAPSQLMADSSAAVIASELARLGLIESPTATYDCTMGAAPGRCPQYRLYYMHGIGHGIGLNVHDPGTSGGQRGAIARGDAFTIEPGIYVRAALPDILQDTPGNRALAAKIRPVVARYANIGVRIEDDYIVTARGLEWVSRAPREIADVEAAMRDRSAGPMPRDSAIVNWYRATEPRQPARPR